MDIVHRKSFKDHKRKWQFEHKFDQQQKANMKMN